MGGCLMVSMRMRMPHQLGRQPSADTKNGSDKNNRRAIHKQAFHGTGANFLDTVVSWSNG